MYLQLQVPQRDPSPDKSLTACLRHSKSFPTALKCDSTALHGHCCHLRGPRSYTLSNFLIVSEVNELTCLKASKNVRSTHGDISLNSLSDGGILQILNSSGSDVTLSDWGGFRLVLWFCASSYVCHVTNVWSVGRKSVWRLRGRPGVLDPRWFHLDQKSSVVHANNCHADFPRTPWSESKI
jgi:hypothetical protein